MRDAFWHKKHHEIKWKNRIHLSLYCVVKDMKRNLHDFFYDLNNFL